MGKPFFWFLLLLLLPSFGFEFGVAEAQQPDKIGRNDVPLKTFIDKLIVDRLTVRDS